MTGDDHTVSTYHVTESGIKWPNCLVCHSENTTVVPDTGEWTCQDCGHQWHSDETVIDDGDGATIGDQIEGMLRMLGDESPAELVQLADDRGVDLDGDSDE